LTGSSQTKGEAFVSTLSDEQSERLWFDWVSWARTAQLPPSGDWTTWLMLGGRGSGKTRAGAEWVRARAADPDLGGPIALVGETMEQARAVMVEGESGLLAIHPDDERPKFDRSRNALKWPNGNEALLMSGSEPERFRGPQFAVGWCDEVGKWPNAEAAWDMLQFGLRLGQNPQQVATTTPRPTRLIKRLLADPLTVVTRMRTADNKKMLARSFLGEIVGRYGGTHLGRQELDGELIEDLPDAMWKRSELEAARLSERPALQRIVVAVDPPVTGHKRSDGCGIVVAATCDTGAVVLCDRSLKPAPPLRWAQAAVRAFKDYQADAVVAEVNQGGDLVKEMLRQVDPNVPVIAVHATRGKWLRAEPVAALYAQQKIRHMAGLSELEDEMCSFGPNGLADGHSPDRLDALVWALTELMLGKSVPRVRSS
jgi:phage terminase large subunit-like protein